MSSALAPDPATQDVLSAWQAVRADPSIQYAAIPAPKPSRPPEWLETLLRWLSEMLGPAGQWLGRNWPVLQWVIGAIGVIILLWLLGRLLAPVLGRRTRKPDQTDAWTPDHAEALALLEDADALAAEGRFDEATHLLLQRSIGQISRARPDWLEPSSTAREIARLPSLPPLARQAFGAIAERVERSLFALHPLGSADWQAARAAYAQFAASGIEPSG